MTKLSVTMNAHGDPDLLRDTIASIRKHLTGEILVVVDGSSDSLDGESFSSHKVRGLPHGRSRCPSKNMAIGLEFVAKTFPHSDWYCYMEPDVLVGSSEILGILENSDSWMMGCDLREGNIRLPFFSYLSGMNQIGSAYLLGCCLFFRGEFLRKLEQIGFFGRFHSAMSPFDDGIPSGYSGYDFSEHLYPTLAKSMGGKIEELSCWNHYGWKGRGSFPMRFRPELEGEEFRGACLMHPVKSLDHPARRFRRLIVPPPSGS